MLNPSLPPTRYRNILRIAVPAAVAGVVEPVISLIDSVFVGKIGVTALASVGVASSLFLLFVWIFGQGKSAISALVSQHYGRNQLYRIQIVSYWAMISWLGLVVLVTLFCWFASSFLLTFYGITGAILDAATTYFKIRIVGLPLTLFYILGFGFFRGIQNTTVAMHTTLIGGACNLLLDALFVLGFDWGIEGVAWASLLSQGIMAAYMAYRISPYLSWYVRIPKTIRPLLYAFYEQSIQLFFRTAVLNCVYFFSNRSMAKLGSPALAAHGIAMNIWLFSSFFLDGYANASNAIGGALLGIKDLSGIRLLKRRILLLGGGTGAVLGIVYFMGFPLWKNWFTSSSTVFEALTELLPFLCGIQVFNGLAFALDGFYKGFAEARFLRNVLIISTVTLYFPSLYFIYPETISGVWIAINFWMFGRFILPFLYFSKTIAKP